MANHSRQPNTTLALFTPSECIAWLTVFSIEAVAMVTLNALEIFVSLKERSLRKRSMFLVINQAVADMFVGGDVILKCWLLAGNCDFWAINFFSIVFYMLLISFYSFLPLAPLLNLATFRPLKHHLVKNKIFGVVLVVVWITPGLFTTGVVLSYRNQLYAFKECNDILLT